MALTSAADLQLRRNCGKFLSMWMWNMEHEEDINLKSVPIKG